MNERQLNFEKGRVEVLTLDELEQSHVENYHDGTPVGGMYHFEVMHRVLELLEKMHVPYEVKEIFAVDNRHGHTPGVTLHHDLEEKFGIQTIPTYTLRRIFANIKVGNETAEGYSSNLAVSYTQSGCAVAWGPFCHVCHNQTILSADHIFANYTLPGRQRLDTPSRNIMYMLTSFEQTFLEEFEKSESEIQAVLDLKQFPLCAREVREFIGEMSVQRTLCESRNKAIKTNGIYPLSDANINRCVESLAGNELLDGCTAYDLLNATNFYCKPRYSVFENIFVQSYLIYKAIKGYTENGVFDFTV